MILSDTEFLSADIHFSRAGQRFSRGVLPAPTLQMMALAHCSGQLASSGPAAKAWGESKTSDVPAWDQEAADMGEEEN